jgi:hypothetical protein
MPKTLGGTHGGLVKFNPFSNPLAMKTTSLGYHTCRMTVLNKSAGFERGNEEIMSLESRIF